MPKQQAHSSKDNGETTKKEEESFAFEKVPNKEAIAYLKNKGVSPAFSYKDVWAEEHAFAFTVAKATEIDLLEDIRNSVETALSEGKTFQQFQKELKPILQEKGWWGEKEMIDPKTGESTIVQLGSPRRLKTIYTTNLKTARMAGKWERAERTKDTLPYFIYTLGSSKNHRKDHERFKGLILPVDDPFWDKHFPPNGWGCKCSVRQISEHEAKRKGGASKSPKVKYETITNDRTGKEYKIPQDVDPAFATNPAKERQKNMDTFLKGKLEGLEQNLARVAVKDMVSSFYFEGIYNGESKGSVPVGVLPIERQKQLGVNTRVVQFSSDTAKKGADKHSDIKQGDYEKIQYLMEQGECVEDRDNHLTFIGKIEGKHWKAVIKRTVKGDELYLQTLHKIKDKDIERIQKRKR